MSSGSNSTDGRKVIADNRRARHDFLILETLEAGLSLLGTEVKSLRDNGATIADAYISVKSGEAFVSGMHIAPYTQASVWNHEPNRDRRLLLHRREIDDLHVQVSRKGHTIVPLTLYFSGGRAKLAIGVAKGKDKGDKRQAIAERDVKRQVDRELKYRD